MQWPCVVASYTAPAPKGVGAVCVYGRPPKLLVRFDLMMRQLMSAAAYGLLRGLLCSLAVPEPAGW